MRVIHEEVKRVEIERVYKEDLKNFLIHHCFQDFAIYSRSGEPVGLVLGEDTEDSTIYRSFCGGDLLSFDSTDALVSLIFEETDFVSFDQIREIETTLTYKLK